MLHPLLMWLAISYSCGVYLGEASTGKGSKCSGWQEVKTETALKELAELFPRCLESVRNLNVAPACESDPVNYGISVFTGQRLQFFIRSSEDSEESDGVF